MNEIMMIVFKLRSNMCSIETEYVQEIINFRKISAIPDMPEYIEGVIELRGTIVPVVNLNKRFDLEYDDNILQASKIIVTKINKDFVGFIVDEVLEIANIASDNIDQLPKFANKLGRKYIKSVSLLNEKIISTLDITNIINIEDLVIPAI